MRRVTLGRSVAVANKVLFLYPDDHEEKHQGQKTPAHFVVIVKVVIPDDVVLPLSIASIKVQLIGLESLDVSRPCP